MAWRIEGRPLRLVLYCGQNKGKYKGYSTTVLMDESRQGDYNIDRADGKGRWRHLTTQVHSLSLVPAPFLGRPCHYR